MLPIWTLPYVWCEIRDKMQVVYKELTRNWVNSKVAESQFYSWKKCGRMRGKFTISSIKFDVNFLQECWIMRIEYEIKCRLSTRKWHVRERSLMWQNGI